MSTEVATAAPIETDVVIVGAGPAGLFQVFELGLLGIKSHIVDTLKHPGGQCAELYPDKPIYDIPALPMCGAQELVDRLLQQIKPFGPEFHFGQEVTSLRRREDGRFDLETSLGTRFTARAVVVAAAWARSSRAGSASRAPTRSKGARSTTRSAARPNSTAGTS